MSPQFPWRTSASHPPPMAYVVRISTSCELRVAIVDGGLPLPALVHAISRPRNLSDDAHWKLEISGIDDLGWHR